MASDRLGTLLNHIRLVGAARQLKAVADGELLQRFEASGDADAFAALVQRHGGLVLGVCRHVLGHDQDAEDAYQATFLVLARRAGSIRKKASLASWLHGVAYRTAATMKRAAARRRKLEGQIHRPKPHEFSEGHALHELQAIVDQELHHLPEKYRVPFVECCLNGRSKEETARLIGWKTGTVSGRLAQARKLLRQRLARRGVALSAAICVIEASRLSATAAVPGTLMTTTVRVAVLYQAGRVQGLVSASVLACAERLVRSMALIKIKAALACLLAVGLVAAGSGATGWLLPGLPSNDARAVTTPQTGPPTKAQAPLPASPGNQEQPPPRSPAAQPPRQVADLRGPQIVLNDQVAADLKLSADQIRQIKAMDDKVKDKYKDDLARFAPDKQPRIQPRFNQDGQPEVAGQQAREEAMAMLQFQEEQMKILNALSTEERQVLNEALPAILEPGQLKRLRQIDLQTMNVHAFMDRRVIEVLHLTVEQKRQIEKAAREATDAMTRSFPRAGVVVFDAQREIEVAEKKLRKVNAEWMSKIVALLTPEQRQAWQELIGQLFELQLPRPPKMEEAAVLPPSGPGGSLAGVLLAGLMILISLAALLYARQRRFAGKENAKRNWRRVEIGALVTVLFFIGLTFLLLVSRTAGERSPDGRALVWKINGKIGAMDGDAVAAKAQPVLTDRDMMDVAESTSLISLEIDHTEITDKALQHLDRFPNLVLLSVGHTQITDVGMAEIAKLKKLTELRIDNVPLSDAGLQQLAGLTELEYLMLDETHITDAGLAHLRGMTKLQKLSLWRTRVSDAGIKHLSHLPALKHLSLDETAVSDAGLDAILEFPRLKYLSVWNTQVTSAGAEDLRSGRPTMKINR